jgi:hypothetical protein
LSPFAPSAFAAEIDREFSLSHLTRPSALYRRFRKQAEAEYAGTSSAIPPSTLWPRRPLFPTKNQVRYHYARRVKACIADMLGEIGLDMGEDDVANARGLLSFFETRDRLEELDLEQCEYYEAIAFFVRGFEHIAKNAVEIALDGTHGTNDKSMELVGIVAE